MKKIIFSALLIMFIPALVIAQEKVEAPVWNVGDKWVFSQGNIEVVAADQNNYTIKLPPDKTSAWVLESGGFDKIIFEKATLNRIYGLKGDKREKYTSFRRTHLNFPFSPGKKWKDTFATQTLVGYHAEDRVAENTETYAVLGWEEVDIRAGKFRALKLECEYVVTGPLGYWGQTLKTAGKAWYWYSPEGKYFVKGQYDEILKINGLKDWELTSFQLKK